MIFFEKKKQPDLHNSPSPAAPHLDFINQAHHTVQVASLTPMEADSLLLLSSGSLSTRASISVTLSLPLSREGTLRESLHILFDLQSSV